MASQSDLYNYSGESFESLVERVLSLLDNIEILTTQLEEKHEAYMDLQERLSEVLDR